VLLLSKFLASVLMGGRAAKDLIAKSQKTIAGKERFDSRALFLEEKLSIFVYVFHQPTPRKL